MEKESTSLLSETIFIPLSLRERATAELPLSVRLSNVLQNLGYRALGDLHGKSYGEIYFARNCGRGTIIELTDFVGNIQRGEFGTKTSAPKIVLTPQQLNLAQLIEFIDVFFDELAPRDKDVLSLRFGVSGKPVTLGEVGEKYGVTRERVRQIQNDGLKRLKNRLGCAGEKLFERLKRDCLAAVCPLTPQLLVCRAQRDAAEFRFPPAFYVRLLAELAPEIPALPEGRINERHAQNERASKICRAIKSFLARGYEPELLAEVFEHLKTQIDDLTERDFLNALRSSNYLALNLDEPDKPSIRLIGKRSDGETAL